MTCPTQCYKEIHCYICNVCTDVTNKYKEIDTKKKYFIDRTIIKGKILTFRTPTSFFVSFHPHLEICRMTETHCVTCNVHTCVTRPVSQDA